MEDEETTPSYSPVCPNHGAPLEGCGFPLPTKGTGVCPISGAEFDFEATLDSQKTTQDKFGNVTKQATWRLSGEETN